MRCTHRKTESPSSIKQIVYTVYQELIIRQRERKKYFERCFSIWWLYTCCVYIYYLLRKEKVKKICDREKERERAR